MKSAQEHGDIVEKYIGEEWEANWSVSVSHLPWVHVSLWQNPNQGSGD